MHHRFRVVYDGMSAVDHRMRWTYRNQIGEGMQRYVGAQLCYFVEGRLPTRIMGETDYYRLDDVQQPPACWIADMEITTSVAAMASGFILRDVVGGLVGDALKDFIKLAVRHFFAECFAAVNARRLIEHPPFERIEPVLTIPGANMPFLDNLAEHELQKDNLYRRKRDGLALITSPLRRSATYADVWFDDERLGRLEHRMHSEEDIASAVRTLYPSNPPNVWKGAPTSNL